MAFKLLFTDQAYDDLLKIQKNKSLLKRQKAVHKALAYLESDPRHPALNTHKFTAFTGVHGEDVFEAYAEKNTPAAYRIFWYYGPKKSEITIIAITSHP